jgi:hypothetical protein
MAATMNPTFKPTYETSLDEEAQDTTIELIVNGKSFNVNKSVVSVSTFIKDTLEFSRESTISFSLPDKVKNPQQIMEWVLQYLQYHAHHPVSQITLPLVSDDLKESGLD